MLQVKSTAHYEKSADAKVRTQLKETAKRFGKEL
jgi:hypothetical protein